MSRRFYYRLSALQEQAKSRPSGYYEDVVSRGNIEGDLLYISPEQLRALRLKYQPGARPIRGLGDRVALIAKPIARAIDGILGTDLVNCGGCAKRQAALNERFPTH